MQDLSECQTNNHSSFDAFLKNSYLFSLESTESNKHPTVRMIGVTIRYEHNICTYFTMIDILKQYLVSYHDGSFFAPTP